MKMADLTRESGVSTASIKFYLREGLLHPGERTAPNQATYGDSHIRRLRLIRALRDVGGVSISSIRQAIAAIEQPRPGGILAAMGCVVDALGETQRAIPESSTQRDGASRDISAFLTRVHLPDRPESSAREALVAALMALREFEPRFPTQILEPYVAAVQGLAAWEVSQAAPTPTNLTESLSAGASPSSDPQEILEGVVYGTLLFEPVILALRRLHHEKFAVEGITPSNLPEWADRFTLAATS